MKVLIVGCVVVYLAAFAILAMGFIEARRDAELSRDRMIECQVVAIQCNSLLVDCDGNLAYVQDMFDIVWNERKMR